MNEILKNIFLKINFYWNTVFVCLILTLSSMQGLTQTNYNEASVPEYNLPPFIHNELDIENDSFHYWEHTRKYELIALFASEIYGEFPSIDYSINFQEKILSESYLNDKAIVKEIIANVKTEYGHDRFSMLFVYPRTNKPKGVFLALNAYGNHAIDTLKKISIHKRWERNNAAIGIENNLASECPRGVNMERCPLEHIVECGYGLATVYCGEFDPDFDDGFENGYHPLWGMSGSMRSLSSGATISIWAKGISLMADYFSQNPGSINTIAIGHSRLGKAALWAAVNDEDISAVISNNSGCGGAALYKRKYGETINAITNKFPHWFCENHLKYQNKEEKLSIDQHQYLALLAPRPIYVASATKDRWADPYGEFLSIKHASEIYRLAGHNIKFPDTIPEVDKSFNCITGYHIREGNHDIKLLDWKLYINWCDTWIKKNE